MLVFTRPQRSHLVLVLIAACFFLRAAFYAVSYPVWEGYDEWSHYAVVERMALRHEVLVQRDGPVSLRVADSLKLAPVPWQLKSAAPPAVTEDAFWRLPESERETRQRAFEALPAQVAIENREESFRAYEALQPPLYYWLMAPLLALMHGASLGASIITLRLAGCVLATLTIPLVYMLAQTTFDSVPISLGCAAIAALMPEFCINIARVGNESLAVPLFTAVTWLAAEGYRSGFGSRRSAALGCILGCGLLAKAYFLTVLPVLAVIFFLAYRRLKLPPWIAARNAGVTYLIAGGIGSWWYIRNVLTTGTVSGLLESVTLRSLSATGFLARAMHANYASGIDAILFSHLWFGGWSGLTIRSWMYHLFYLVILLAGIGLLRHRFRGLAATSAIYFTFWLGLLYNIALLFVSNGVSTCMGWYLYAAVGAEIVLCWGGLRALVPARWAAWVTALGTSLFGLLDLYTLHIVSLPYYTGMIAHRTDGSLAPLRGSDWTRVGLATAIDRLGVFKGGWGSPAALIFAWTLYLLGTLLLIGLGIRLGCEQAQGTHERDCS
jgi:hypothetical protein